MWRLNYIVITVTVAFVRATGICYDENIKTFSRFLNDIRSFDLQGKRVNLSLHVA